MRRLLTPAEAAEYIGRSEDGIRQMVHRRQIPHVKTGKLLRFDIRDLDMWINEHKVQAR